MLLASLFMFIHYMVAIVGGIFAEAFFENGDDRALPVLKFLVSVALGVEFFFLVPAVAVEDRGINECVTRCRRLVSGFRISILITLAGLLLALWALDIVAELAGLSMYLLLQSTSVHLVVSLLISALGYAMLIVIYAMAYVRIRTIKEGAF